MTPSQRNQDSELAALLAPDILVMLEESPGDVAAETEELHPKDLADVAEAMPRDRVAEFLRALPAARAADGVDQVYFGATVRYATRDGGERSRPARGLCCCFTARAPDRDTTRRRAGCERVRQPLLRA